MGIPIIPLPSKLMIAITYDPSVSLDRIYKTLDSRFGNREYSYGPIPFSWTKYYAGEMGENLMKVYFNYQSNFDRQQLADVKLFTNDLEMQYATGDKRKVNIDPGYISRDKLALATTKDFYHRLYLGNGIYGEVTLHYRKGKFRYFSWTYPDYRQTPLHQFLERARATLVKGIRDSE